MAVPPLSIYIHLPWCIRKCPYCDFNSHQGVPHKDKYLQALIRELRIRAVCAEDRQILSIYCGGGTPNLLEPDFYRRLFTEISHLYTIDQNCEITLEANPGSQRIHDFIGYSQAGINRLSIGVQSFLDDSLQAIGRDYTSQDIYSCLLGAQQSPINNINIDLMFALPRQNKYQALADLHKAIEQQPQHISIYELTLEQNTLFYSKPPKELPDDDAKADAYNRLISTAQSHGYQQYEISAFAKAGKESRHNCNYWQFGDYIGIGAGAHGKITHADPFVVQRYSNHKQPATYMNSQAFTSNQRYLTQKDIFNEWCINSFRLKNGADIHESCSNTGFSTEQLKNYLSPISGYLQQVTDRIQLKEYFYFRHNSVLQTLIDQ